MKVIKGLACEYWIENTARIYEENLHVSTPVIEAFEAGFLMARKIATKLADESPLHCQCAVRIEDMGEEEEEAITTPKKRKKAKK